MKRREEAEQRVLDSWERDMPGIEATLVIDGSPWKFRLALADIKDEFIAREDRPVLVCRGKGVYIDSSLYSGGRLGFGLSSKGAMKPIDQLTIKIDDPMEVIETLKHRELDEARKRAERDASIEQRIKEFNERGEQKILIGENGNSKFYARIKGVQNRSIRGVVPRVAIEATVEHSDGSEIPLPIHDLLTPSGNASKFLKDNVQRFFGAFAPDGEEWTPKRMVDFATKLRKKFYREHGEATDYLLS